jgi:hypothetical protein
MSFTVERSIEVLERTPLLLKSMLSGVSDFWVMSAYGEGTFSPFDVVGHLIEGERHDWMVRARTILEHGQSAPFRPFDRYAMYETSRGKTIEDLLRTFAELRAGNVAAIRTLRLGDEHLTMMGRHPAFGAVTLRQLLATWVVHDLGHIHQVAKAMAYQYKGEVGPWVEYLTILPRPT